MIEFNQNFDNMNIAQKTFDPNPFFCKRYQSIKYKLVLIIIPNLMQFKYTAFERLLNMQNFQ